MTIALHGQATYGPLQGVRIIEFAGIGPAPFAAMMLADAGAEIIRIDRLSQTTSPWQSDAYPDLLNRGRPSVAVDLKHPEGKKLAFRLIQRADGLIEGFRPGVMERLGLGPSVCLDLHRRLVYGRITGWGQDGDLSQRAGHDINYIALSGALGAFGRAGERPLAPLNLVGDFGGGGMMLAFGMLAAIIHASETGTGQVVDAAMVDGASLLMTMIYGMRTQGIWTDQRGTNLLDTGAHFYEVYETSDGKFMAVGALEPQFYKELIRLMGLVEENLPQQMDRESWPRMKVRFTEIFVGKSRAEWEVVFAGSDACVTSVLSMKEALENPHLIHRKTFAEVDGVVQPSPAPRFSATPGSIQRPPSLPGQDANEVLTNWSISEEEIDRLRQTGV